MANMELITSVTVGSGGAASVTLPATGTIPSTYTDLKIVASIRTTQANIWSTTLVSFNGSSSNLSWRRLIGDGSAPDSGSGSTGLLDISNGASSTSNTFSNFEMYIPNYTSTSNAKSYSVDSVNENNGTTAYSSLLAGLWNPGTQAAITSIGLTPGSGSFVEFTSFSLYGISSVTSTPKATGGIVSQDATYWYHTFPFSSTFTPTQNITCDYLVIAGGGAGSSTSNNYGGGGGAGGLRSTVTATGGGGSLESALSLTAQAYTVTIGAGGAGENQDTSNAQSGSNSVFATITATGGGGAGRTSSTAGTGFAGSAGGSGGGGTGTSGGTGGAASPSGQGYAGGNAGGSGAGAGGGGGGAGSVGSNGSGSTGGNGGNGVAISAFANATFTGVNTFYAGGGGGASGTAGTATAGGGTGNGTSGTINTGGGGGGKNGTGGSGGSGLVIVRYAK